jgi:ectoine hydroxylase-related dioxygenase (phytanoyl-CoA dioxygenase family)
MSPSSESKLRRELTNSEIAKYREQGYLVLNNVLDEEELLSFRDECMEHWLAEKGEYQPDATWLQNALLPNIHHKSPLVLKYYFDGPLVDVAQQLIGENIKGATSQLTFKLRGNKQTFDWHQDNGYGQLEPANAISTLTALDDTDEENGCLWILPGSHKQGQIDVSQDFNSDDKAAGTELTMKVANPETAIPLILKAGDAVVFHCHTIHRSEGNQSTIRDRRILFMRYADADAVEVYNDGKPRLGPLLRGKTRFKEVQQFEQSLQNNVGSQPNSELNE